MPPQLRQVVLDGTDVRALAEFWRAVTGYAYRPGDEPPPAGEPDARGAEWLVLRAPDGGAPGLAFQHVDALTPSTWPDDDVPQQLHLDLSVESPQELDAELRRLTDLGARVLLDRRDDLEEPLYVFADPAGHPFCVFCQST